MIKGFLKFVVFAVIVAGVGFLGYKAGFLAGQEDILKTPPAYIGNLDNASGTQNVDFSIFWETWRTLENNFLEKEKLNGQDMVYGAIEGMIASADDPYTVFFTPKATDDFKEELSGKYEGVGMYVGIKDEQLTVISPIKGTPAFLAGILAGDKIIKIDETETFGLSVDEAVAKIKGPSGTSVKLTIQRQAVVEPKEFVIKRQSIKIPTAELEFVGKNKDIALVKMYQFNEILTSEFSRLAIDIVNVNTNKIIIDLRNNPGGYLEVAQQIAGWFLEKGAVVVWEDRRNEERQKEPLKALGPSTFANHRVVVLINQGSASASEILAGALRDNRNIKLVGEKSFGKGSVQEQINLSDGSSLKVTIAKWLTPKENLIDGEGLKPDIEVKMPENAEPTEDPQLSAAIELFK